LLKQYFIISLLVALTGILLPIALSFILIPLFWSPTITPLTAFTAGASLCSTSLGTTYAILSAAQLERTRIGTVLVVAAMMDDVVGLIMVSLISSLTETVDAKAIGRPIGVSFAFLFASSLVMSYIPRVLKRFSKLIKKIQFEGLGFVVSGLALLGLVAAAGYAGTSILFVGYLTGISASYLFEGPDELDGSFKNPALDCYEKYVFCAFSENRYFAGVKSGLLLPFFFVPTI
jgi:Kef-type K+ transport system membrane component KefB